MSLLPTCKYCQHPGWCQKHGCTTWNDYSRRKFDDLRKRAAEDNKLMDDLMDDLERMGK